MLLGAIVQPFNHKDRSVKSVLAPVSVWEFCAMMRASDELCESTDDLAYQLPESC